MGIVIGESKKEFSVRLGEDIVTDKYIQIKMESSLPGSSSPYLSGWVFYPKVEMIEVKSSGDSNQGKYSDTKTGKHQNLFDPIPEKQK